MKGGLGLKRDVVLKVEAAADRLKGGFKAQQSSQDAKGMNLCQVQCGAVVDLLLVKEMRRVGCRCS